MFFNHVALLCSIVIYYYLLPVIHASQKKIEMYCKVNSFHRFVLLAFIKIQEKGHCHEILTEDCQVIYRRVKL